MPLLLTRASLATMGVCLHGVAWCVMCGEVVANIVQDRAAVCTVLKTAKCGRCLVVCLSSFINII